MIPLVARPLVAQANVGLQVVGQTNSEGWKPTLAVLTEANEGGWPTPYARAANAAFLLAELPQTAGTPTVTRVQSMFLALTLGALRPRLVDLRQGGAFERALRNAEPELERFWALEDAKGRIYGYSYPSCLFWPHARRGEQDWRDLDATIGSRAGQARSILARFATSLASFGGLAHADDLAWKLALEHLSRGTEPMKDDAWQRDVRFVGPFELDFPRQEGKPKRELLYLPTYHPGASDEFQRATSLSLVGGDFLDGRSVRHGSVSLPHGAGPHLVAGSGNAEVAIQPPLGPVGPGPTAAELLVAQLAPVVAELKMLGRNLNDCGEHPFAYPDAVRWLALAGLFGEGTVRATSWATALRASSPGLPAPGKAGGHIWEGVQYVEHIGATYVGDLAAMGRALYVAFSTDMSIRNGMVFDPDRGQPLLHSSEAIALEATTLAHEALPESSPSPAYFAQLATLQRFVNTYDTRAAEMRGTQDGATVALLAACAKAYAARVYGAEVRPLGSRGTWSQHLTLTSSLRVPVAQDVHLPLRKVY